MKLSARDPRITAAGYFVGALAAFTLGGTPGTAAERLKYRPDCALLAAIDALQGRQAQAEAQMVQHLKLTASHVNQRSRAIAT